MRKKLLALAVVALLGAQAFPQTTGPGYYCGPTGFDINLGVANKSFRCGFQRIQRGIGSLTLNGTSTVTSSGGFAGIATPDAVPGADGVFFKTSGLWYRFGATPTEYYLRVSAKASDSSITVLAGAAGSANSGTVTEWGYWNTTCYRSASNLAVYNVTLDHLDPRIWGYANSFTDADLSLAMPSTLTEFMYTPAAGAPATLNIASKPRGMRILISGTQATFATGTSSATAGEAASVSALYGGGAAGTASIVNMDVQFLIQSTAAASYPVACIVSTK